MLNEIFAKSDYFDSESKFRFTNPVRSHQEAMKRNAPTISSPLVCQDLLTEQVKSGIFALYGKLLVYSVVSELFINKD